MIKIFTEKSTFFSVKLTFFLNKEVNIELISRNVLRVIAFFSTFPHCALCAAGAVFKFWSDENSSGTVQIHEKQDLIHFRNKSKT